MLICWIPWNPRSCLVQHLSVFKCLCVCVPVLKYIHIRCVYIYIYIHIHIHIYHILSSLVLLSLLVLLLYIYIIFIYVYLHAHILKHEKNMNPSSSCWFSGVQASSPAPAVSFLRLNDGQGASDQQRRPGIRWTQRQPRQNVVPLLSRSHEVGPGLQLGEHNSNNYT